MGYMGSGKHSHCRQLDQMLIKRSDMRGIPPDTKNKFGVI